MNHIEIADLAHLHQRKSAKWRMYPPDVIPMGLAEMDFSVAPKIQQTLSEMVQGSDLGYGGIAPELGHAFAEFAARRWGWRADPEQCWLVTDVAIAGIETMRQYCNPGDVVGISSPVYHDFVHWISEVKCTAVDVPLLHHGNGEWRLDLDGIESAFANGMKIYILCNPHNPVGHVPRRGELEQLADLADEYNVVVISDEIHAPLTYSPHDFTPYLSINAQSRRTGVVITSASKAWNTAGLKCAQVITQDEQRREDFKHFPEHTSWRASILGSWANITAYRECGDWLDSAIAQLDSNRKLLAELLAKHLPDADYSLPECTYLAWIDVSQYRSDLPAKYIREHAGVAFSEGIDFGPAGAGHIRLNFATSPEIITEAIQRTAKLFK